MEQNVFEKEILRRRDFEPFESDRYAETKNST